MVGINSPPASESVIPVRDDPIISVNPEDEGYYNRKQEQYNQQQRQNPNTKRDCGCGCNGSKSCTNKSNNSLITGLGLLVIGGLLYTGKK